METIVSPFSSQFIWRFSPNMIDWHYIKINFVSISERCNAKHRGFDILTPLIPQFSDLFFSIEWYQSGFVQITFFFCLTQEIILRLIDQETITSVRDVGELNRAKVWNKWDTHDDVIKWKHFPRYWHFVRGIHRPPVNSPHKGQWRGALMFSLICAWMSGWENNREAGYLRRNRAYYDVTVMHRSVQHVWCQNTMRMTPSCYSQTHCCSVSKSHYSDVIMGPWRLKSPASPLFTQPFIRAQTKENIKALRHWLWRE